MEELDKGTQSDNSQVSDLKESDILTMSRIVDKGEENEISHEKMKIKCVKCGIIEGIKEDDIKLLAHIVKKYNQKASPVDYLGILSIIKGFCTDNEKHMFIFEKSFDKEIANAIKEYKDAISKNNERKAVLEKVEIQINETKEILKNLEKKREHALAELNAEKILVDDIKLKFIKLTGADDMTIWS